MFFVVIGRDVYMKLEMRPNEFDGKLITFCGLDGCGKTTQIKRLVKWLEEHGYKVYLTKQPTSFIRESEIFRSFMDSTQNEEYDYRALSLLCAADRVQHSNRVISNKLKAGYIVICDRYIYSCLANLIARGYKEDKWIYEVAHYIPKPDLSFFLNVSVENAINRVRSRPEEQHRYIDNEFQVKLHDLYLNIARENHGTVISTMLCEDVCFARVLLEVKKVLHII